MTKDKIKSTIITVITFPLWGSMILAAIALLLGIYLIMWCIPIAAAVLSVGLAAIGLTGTVGSPIVMTESVGAGFTQFGVSLVSIGMAILLAMLAWMTGKKIISLTTATFAKILKFKLKAGEQKK